MAEDFGANAEFFNLAAGSPGLRATPQLFWCSAIDPKRHRDVLKVGRTSGGGRVRRRSRTRRASTSRARETSASACAAAPGRRRACSTAAGQIVTMTYCVGRVGLWRSTVAAIGVALRVSCAEPLAFLSDSQCRCRRLLICEALAHGNGASAQWNSPRITHRIDRYRTPPGSSSW